MIQNRRDQVQAHSFVVARLVQRGWSMIMEGAYDLPNSVGNLPRSRSPEFSVKARRERHMTSGFESSGEPGVMT
jgi:hypothetical protein